jgi:hypothetical protein
MRESTAGTILRVLARQLEADIDWCEADPHSLVHVTIPVSGDAVSDADRWTAGADRRG